MDNFNLSLINQSLQFDNIAKDFEYREILEKNNSQFSKFDNEIDKNNLTNIENIENMESSLPLMNDNIRANIKLGIEIYKQLKNFDRNYIHEVINEKSKNSK